jgi:hypothetical protein
MTEQASFTLRGRNPDVLTCIANLSNDEVFTPPELAGRMLDMLAEAWAADHDGASLWSDKSVRFLDPFTKSGVFLREITSRLTEGLAQRMPDLQKRVNHILKEQVFGIGITRLTSLLARRSVYCSKYANGAHSIYNRFVEQAKALEPRFLTMVIPSRWLFGGRGLDEFRKEMLNDSRIRKLVDYPDSRQVFPSVDVAGGICYFIWERNNQGGCRVVEFDHSLESSEATRPLLEPGAEVFIRSNRALSILRKVMDVETGSESLALPDKKRFEKQVSSQKPFGLRTFFRGAATKSVEQDVLVLQSGGRAWTSKSQITAGVELIDKWKVFTSKSSSEHAGQVDKKGQRRVLSLSGVIPPGSVVTETYILLGAYDTEQEARNCFSYVVTRFFRFLIAVRSSAQDLARSAYSFVPLQDFSRAWKDEDLYAKYALTADETTYIAKLIRPMEVSDE